MSFDLEMEARALLASITTAPVQGGFAEDAAEWESKAIDTEEFVRRLIAFGQRCQAAARKEPP